MEPSKYPIIDFYRFGKGGETLVSPLVLLIALVGILGICLLPRRHMIWAYLFPLIIIPNSQAVMLSTVHVRMGQILTLVAIVRLAQRGFLRRIVEKNALDRAFVYWAISYAIIFMLRWHTGGAVINQVGNLFDTLGTYYVLRVLIRDDNDVASAIRAFAVICCVVGVLMLVEHQTGHNPLAVLGGVRELSEVRNGFVRSTGPFEQAIPAGVFGAVMVPLFVALWVRGRGGKVLSILGIVAGLTIAATSGSSTPLMAIAGCIGTFMIWPIRKQMRWVRWGIVATLLVLEIVMKADVWWLIARIDVAGGSTGWYRSALIDNAIHHFGEWWLLGTNNNVNWGYGMYDLCNWYVAQAVLGGLATFVLFILVITQAFKRLGRARHAAEGNSRKEFFVWVIGAGLFSQVCGFFGTSYYDQAIVSWLALLAMISAVTRRAPTTKSKQEGSVVFETRDDSQLAIAGQPTSLAARL